MERLLAFYLQRLFVDAGFSYRFHFPVISLMNAILLSSENYSPSVLKIWRTDELPVLIIYQSRPVFRIKCPCADKWHLLTFADKSLMKWCRNGLCGSVLAVLPGR
jgi:hypothetical protein